MVLTKLSTALLADTDAFLRHILHHTGEPHSNPNVSGLIDALYRYTGLAPDPPSEFKGYASEESPDSAFVAFEICVDQRPREERKE